MSEVMKDFAIKLFGKTICFPPDDNKVVYDHITVSEQRQSSSETSTSQDSKDLSRGSFTRSKHENDSSDPTDEDESLTEAATSSDITDDPNSPCLEKDSQEKTLKKPDKLLPCPRCNSMDTKFCYYNNYNVSQPRHFCKKCQRYWTAGGTMRNVPVGSGRRKNKNALVTNYDHVMVSDYRADTINGRHCGPHEVHGPSGFPVVFYPSTPYWGCAMPSCWNGPWASLGQSPGPIFSTLGKHSREGNMKEERPVLMPKTLRIHDPSDAAKSSIWSTLGIKNRTIGSTNGTSLFKAFGSKGDRNVSNVDNSKLVLHANPAALSRSLNFHETS